MATADLAAGGLGACWPLPDLLPQLKRPLGPMRELDCEVVTEL